MKDVKRLGWVVLVMLAAGCGGGGSSEPLPCDLPGACPEGQHCDLLEGECRVGVCPQECGDRVCGADPRCGESCGACSGAGEVCVVQTGQCLACTQDCSGRVCGPDPVCGASCGECQANEDCDASGQCQCAPACLGKECGDDGCGWICGACQPGERCNAAFQCEPGPAYPEILLDYPPPAAYTSATRLTARGRVGEGAALVSLQVNGVPVVTSDGFRSWSVEMATPAGVTPLEVEAEDETGDTRSFTLAQIHNQGPLPTSWKTIAYDVEREKAFTVESSYIVESDLSVDPPVRRIVSSASVGAGPGLFLPAGMRLDGERLLVVQNNSGHGELLAVELVSGDRTMLSSATQGSGPAFGLIYDLVLDAAGTQAYVVDNTLDAVVRVNLANGNRTLVSGGSNPTVGSGPALSYPHALVWRTTGSELWVADQDLHGLVRIDLATGDRELAAEDGQGGCNFNSFNSIGRGQFQIVVADTDTHAVVGVDFDTGACEELSGPNLGTGPALKGLQGLLTYVQQVGDIHVYRALVGDAGRLLRVGLSTGDRTLLDGAGLGAGEPLVEPLGVALEPETGRVLAVDGTEGILAIDPGTGDRTPLALSGEPILEPVDIALDGVAGARIVWVVGRAGALLWRVDLQTGLVTAPAAGAFTDEQLRAVAVDGRADRVLLVDFWFQRVLAVDRGTGAVSELAHEAGEFANLTGLCVDESTGRIFLTKDGDPDKIYELDRATGASVVVIESDGGLFVNPQRLVCDLVPGRERILASNSSGYVFAIDPATGEDEQLLNSLADDGALNVRRAVGMCLDTTRGMLFLADSLSHALFAVDPDGGFSDRVVISK